MMKPHVGSLSLAEVAHPEGMLAFRAYIELCSLATEQNKDFEPAFHQLITNTTDYNRQRVLKLLFNPDNYKILRSLDSQSFLSQFKLYAEIMQRWPRLGFNLIEGMIEAERRGVFPKDLSARHPVLNLSERDAILRFIQKSQGFIPSVFQAFQKRGDKVFANLDKDGQAILDDLAGTQYLRNIVKRYQNGSEHADQGWEFLLACIQRFSPTSGASFIKKSEQIGLLKDMVAAGDLRSHLPRQWKQTLKPFVLTRGKYRLPDGAKSRS